jgi:hypothetical protein
LGGEKHRRLAPLFLTWINARISHQISQSLLAIPQIAAYSLPGLAAGAAASRSALQSASLSLLFPSINVTQTSSVHTQLRHQLSQRLQYTPNIRTSLNSDL